MIDDPADDLLALAQREMVEQIAQHASLVADHIGKPVLADRVMAVMGRVPRHAFVPDLLQLYGYLDQPIPIGFGKTTSQPFMVALMSDLLDLEADDRVLEIGTGLGYHAAVLANLAEQVYSVEIISELAEDAANRLQDYANVSLKVGDGSLGWLAQAPFDKILVTAAPELIPATLLKQLKPGGRMVVPAGLEDAQQLLLVEKDRHGATRTREILPVRFAPLIMTH
jgi:protein-L-isoaspartate(D-aspartate) O-methyltransferase